MPPGKRGNMSADKPYKLEPVFYDSESGIYYDPFRKSWIWEERLDYDATDPRNIAIEAKIAADDRAFLEACGIAAETDNP